MKLLSGGLVQAIRTNCKACVAESRIISVAMFRGVQGTHGGKRKGGDDGNAARKLHPAEGLSYDQLALVETLAIGCHAVDRAAPAPDENVLVIGAGPIGLAVIVFLW